MEIWEPKLLGTLWATLGLLGSALCSSVGQMVAGIEEDTFSHVIPTFLQ